MQENKRIFKRAELPVTPTHPTYFTLYEISTDMRFTLKLKPGCNGMLPVAGGFFLIWAT